MNTKRTELKWNEMTVFDELRSSNGFKQSSLDTRLDNRMRTFKRLNDNNP